MSCTDRSDAPVFVKDFLSYSGTIRNLSSRTVDGYYTDLRTFLRFMKLHRGMVPVDTPLEEISVADFPFSELQTITSRDIYEYLEYVMNDRANNANSRARKLACLRTFFKYCTTKIYPKLENNPVKDIDVPTIRKTIPRFLSLDESMHLLDSVRETEFFWRDYCIITLFLNCGMRLSELVGMNLSSIQGDTATIVGKGNKERLVYLNEACMTSLSEYMKTRAKLAGGSTNDALFLSKRGTRITPRRVEQIVEETLSHASLANRGYSPHKLRHTAATLMYRYGEADLLALREILGHEHVSTTEIYTHISDEQLRKAATSSPLSSVKHERKLSDDGAPNSSDDEREKKSED